MQNDMMQEDWKFENCKVYKGKSIRPTAIAEDMCF